MLQSVSKMVWPADRPEDNSTIVRITSAQQAVILELVNLIEEGVYDDQTEVRLRGLVIASKEVLALVMDALKART